MSKVVPMTNAIRVKMKERQLDICKKYISDVSRGVANAEMLDFALEMVDILPGDIERYKGLAEFDRLVEEDGENAPTVVRFGGTGESLNDIVEKYVNAYRMTPKKPMLKEMVEMYIELLEEEQGGFKEDKGTGQNRNDKCNCGSGKKYKKCCMNKVNTLMSYQFIDTENKPTLIYELKERNKKYFILVSVPSDCKTMMQNIEIPLNANSVEEAVNEYSEPKHFIYFVGNHLIEYYGAVQEKAIELLEDIVTKQEFETRKQYQFVNYLNEISTFDLIKK